jgi:Arc/MetJ-type ribon-helix-helix transcriptional regulator
MAVKRKYTTITIPAPLFEKLKEEIRDTGFSSVSDYVTFILREMVAEMREKGPGKKENRGDVIAKLKALGYVS